MNKCANQKLRSKLPVTLDKVCASYISVFFLTTHTHWQQSTLWREKAYGTHSLGSEVQDGLVPLICT